MALARIRRVSGADRWCTWRRGLAYPGAFGAVIPIAAGIGAWIDGRYKIQRNGKNKPVRLFDLHLDPGETGDLDEVDLERAGDMQAALDLWCSSCEMSAAGGDYR